MPRYPDVHYGTWPRTAKAERTPVGSYERCRYMLGSRCVLAGCKGLCMLVKTNDMTKKFDGPNPHPAINDPEHWAYAWSAPENTPLRVRAHNFTGEYNLPFHAFKKDGKWYNANTKQELNEVKITRWRYA